MNFNKEFALKALVWGIGFGGIGIVLSAVIQFFFLHEFDVMITFGFFSVGALIGCCAVTLTED